MVAQVCRRLHHPPRGARGAEPWKAGMRWPQGCDRLTQAPGPPWPGRPGATPLFGYAAWGWLLARYPSHHHTHGSAGAAVWHGGSALWLDEGLPSWKTHGGCAGDGRPGAESAVAACAGTLAGAKPQGH